MSLALGDFELCSSNSDKSSNDDGKLFPSTAPFPGPNVVSVGPKLNSYCV